MMKFGTRVWVALVAAVIGGVGMLVGEAIDFYFWDIAFFADADTFSEYLRLTWYYPVGVAAVLGVLGFFIGEGAVEIATRFWRDWL